MNGFVGAQHEFHDAAFVRGWADRFVPTPPRLALFDLILEHVSAPGPPNAHVLELGLGPGYMARHILERNPAISYEGLDFSEVFLKPDGTAWDYEAGRFEIDRHLELLRRAGFEAPASLALFEHNIDSPTAAQNYACLMAVK